MIGFLTGFTIAVLGYVVGYIMNSKPKEPPVFHITMPEIKVTMETPKVEAQANHSIDAVDYTKLAEEYEAKYEKENQKKINEAKKMTEEYSDLNGIAQDLLDSYSDGTITD